MFSMPNLTSAPVFSDTALEEKLKEHFFPDGLRALIDLLDYC